MTTGDTRPGEERLALPCGYVFAMSGGRCGAPEGHPVHGFSWHGPETPHDYVRDDRRTGIDRRAARPVVSPGDDLGALRAAAQGVVAAAEPDEGAFVDYLVHKVDALRAALEASPGDDLGALRAALVAVTVHNHEEQGHDGLPLTDCSDALCVQARAALEARPASDAGEPDPLLGMRLAKCPSCGEELSVWPASDAGEPTYIEVRTTACHAGSDGDCSWSGCPQLRDGEPRATGRHCPLDFQPAALDAAGASEEEGS
jgi:hypothetical protein